jgi:hypothetical protein
VSNFGISADVYQHKASLSYRTCCAFNGLFPNSEDGCFDYVQVIPSTKEETRHGEILRFHGSPELFSRKKIELIDRHTQRNSLTGTMIFDPATWTIQAEPHLVSDLRKIFFDLLGIIAGTPFNELADWQRSKVYFRL